MYGFAFIHFSKFNQLSNPNDYQHLPLNLTGIKIHHLILSDLLNEDFFESENQFLKPSLPVLDNSIAVNELVWKVFYLRLTSELMGLLQGLLHCESLQFEIAML